MSQILKFPDSMANAKGMARLGLLSPEPEAKMPSLPVMTGDQWSEFIRLLTPEEQQAFMADVWKLINLYCRRIGGD
jgi:hypothetical protein